MLGCAGTELTSDEVQFFRTAQPWGLILFRRNIADPSQVRALCDRFREIVGRHNAPVFVDQEGGRVQRLTTPHWKKYPAASSFLRASKGDVALASGFVRLAARLMACDLFKVGITVDCMPVLDVPIAGANPAIGDRAYSSNPDRVAVLGRAAAEGLMSGGILPVIKHMPGHGRALLDSHEALPVVKTDIEALSSTDFVPFKRLSDLPIGMTAHVLFHEIDNVSPATLSKRVIESVIRGEIGFDGLLLSDDLSMKALGGGFRERAERLFVAGCDIALHCNGLMDEARAVVDGVPVLAGIALQRAERALRLVCSPSDAFDPVEGRRKLDEALAHLQ